MSTEVVICAGVGGAGKTTTAAALGVSHALAGRRVVVLTIDPARRLADALGIEHLGNQPMPIPLGDQDTHGGSLHALMLDRKATWDEVIRRYAPDDATAERLLANPYYAALSTRLTGGHEYMATEKLYALVEDGRWDLVVVDTPPSQHALDFFQAPDRIRRILDQRLLGALLRPSEGLLGAATRRVVAVVRRLAGDRVLEDLEEFFKLVADLSSGFRARGASVHALLHDDRTRYFLVANAVSPREDDLLDFLGVLRENGQHFAGFLLNRATAPLGAAWSELRAAVPDAPEGVPSEAWSHATDALLAATAHHIKAAEQHAATARRLMEASRAPVWPLPDLEGGIDDLPSLVRLAGHLPPRAAPRR